MIKKKLTPEGMVLYNVEKHTTLRFNPAETKTFFNLEPAQDYPPPEIVHMEISTKCNLACKYCYVDKTKPGLSTVQWKSIIRDVADHAFQITFGGGEPTLRPDLIELTNFARSVGLNVTMTTNGVELHKYGKELKVFNQINVSVHNLNPISATNNALMYLAGLGITRGINFCFSKEYAGIAPLVMHVAKKTGASILLLGYKPVAGDWENQVPIGKIMEFAEEYKNYGVTIGVDGMTCGKCYGSRRFCDIDCEGNVMPCSFIRTPVGNLLQEGFVDIWNKRPRTITCPYLKG